MSKIWKLKPDAPKELFERFPELDRISVQLLNNRGILGEAEAEKFLNPEYGDLHSPFLFLGMEKAVERIWQAIEDKEQICIYSDYDADAVTANAVLQQTFRYLGVETGSYIPDRFNEGYGVNIEALSKIKDKGVKLVITVDCGTNSTDAADFCLGNGIDLIITDHHEIIGQEPKAFALINPKNPKDKYPFMDITGVGVAFKLAQGILSKTEKVEKIFGSGNGLKPSATEKKYTPGYEKWLLDLVAIGTVADCHSLLGENRILVKYGLKVLLKSKWTGLKALCRIAGLDFSEKLADTYTLGFVIAPRLNAAGRIKHANLALDMLIEQDPQKAQDLALQLESLNKHRQDLTEQVLSEAKEKAALVMDRNVLVLMGENWPKGVVGLVAGRLTEEYHKPVLVMERQGGEATGSARSVGEFNIVEALKHASEYLVRFGGHKQAAGFTLAADRFEEFYQKILEYADKNLTEGDLQKKLELEAEIFEDDLALDTYHAIFEFEPFGVGNPRPKFLASDFKVTGFRTVGNGQKHLQMQLSKGKKFVSAIAFNFGWLAKTLKIGDNVDIAAELIEDGWNGRQDVKLRIVDIKIN